MRGPKTLQNPRGQYLLLSPLVYRSYSARLRVRALRHSQRHASQLRCCRVLVTSSSSAGPLLQVSFVTLWKADVKIEGNRLDSAIRTSQHVLHQRYIHTPPRHSPPISLPYPFTPLTSMLRSSSSGQTFACNPSTQRNVSTKISADPKGEKITYVNGRSVIVGGLIGWGLRIERLSGKGKG